METYVIHIKGLSRDANGLENVVYATESQVEAIANMRDDPQTASTFIEMGSFIFAPKDISFIERKKKDKYDLPAYFKDKVSEEKALGVLPTGGMDARAI